jgi:hypothetical protein
MWAGRDVVDGARALNVARAGTGDGSERREKNEMRDSCHGFSSATSTYDCITSRAPEKQNPADRSAGFRI